MSLEQELAWLTKINTGLKKQITDLIEEDKDVEISSNDEDCYVQGHET